MFREASIIKEKEIKQETDLSKAKIYTEDKAFCYLLNCLIDEREETEGIRFIEKNTGIEYMFFLEYDEFWNLEIVMLQYVGNGFAETTLSKHLQNEWEKIMYQRIKEHEKESEAYFRQLEDEAWDYYKQLIF
jgi:hypothetical protein